MPDLDLESLGAARPALALPRRPRPGGHLRVQPYKDELPLWRFRAPERRSREPRRRIRTAVRLKPRGPEDADKAESARVFKEAWDAVEQVAEYTQWRAEHRSRHG